MEDLDSVSKVLTYISMTLSVSWFALHLSEIVGVVTLITLISAFIANRAKSRYYNSKKRIQEYDHLNKEIKKDEEANS